ncbi:MAG: AmmeMemoRadiSam system protein A [Chloroflexota bacterium]
MEESRRADAKADELVLHPLVALARRAVEIYVKEHRVIELPGDVTGVMTERAGVFVCLKINGDLRGCIGTFEPTCSNIAEETIRNAISAAVRDPRFAPVRAAELARIEYTVDVLTPPERIESDSELDAKRYGVIVRRGAKRGLLLPDLEGVDTVAEQLRITRQKAGISPHELVDLYRFEVRRYK